MTIDILPIPFVEAIDNVPMTDSMHVADFFNKRHFHVIRDIEKLFTQAPKFAKSNFELCFQINELQNGKPQKFYRMTEQGFSLLAMGFTGEKALKFKIAYINAFTSMRAAISNAQIGTLQDVIQKLRVLETEKAKASFAGRTLNEWKCKKEALTIAFESSKEKLQLNLPINELS